MTEFTPRTGEEAVVLRLAAAMNAQDLDALLACMSEDYVRYGEETGWQPMSKAAYKAFGENFFVPFPDVSWEILALVSQGNQVVLHIIERGTFARPWELNGRVIEPTNTAYATHAAVFFTVDADNLVQSYTYIHDNDFVARFGALLDESSASATVPDESRM
jgi:hypothetical protein